MYIMKRDGQIVGYYDNQTEAVQALVEERMKEDSTELYIKRMEDDEDGEASEIRY